MNRDTQNQNDQKTSKPQVDQNKTPGNRQNQQSQSGVNQDHGTQMGSGAAQPENRSRQRGPQQSAQNATHTSGSFSPQGGLNKDNNVRKSDK